MTESAHPTALHGRVAEVRILEACLERTAAGGLQAVLVEGEPGIGKSRVLGLALDLARGRGFRVVAGAADEVERGRPFGVLAEALGCTRHAEDPRRRRIARLIMGGDGARKPGPIGSTGDPGVRYRIIDALVDLVEELALERPVILALDDVQWADPSTLLATRSLTRQLAYSPVALILARRPIPDSPELAKLFDVLARDGAFRMALRPLDRAAVSDLLTEIVGAPPSDSLIEEVSGAAGNPLYVAELVQALMDEGTLEVIAGRAELHERSLPPSLRLTILRRLSFLDGASLELLRTACVFGSVFSLHEVALLLNRSSSGLVEPLRALLRAGMIEERSDRLAFRHDLIREAVYEDIPVDARAALHREAARCLAVAGESTRIAEHLMLGARTGDPETISWLQRAARETAPKTPTTAVRLFERALELADDLPESDAGELLADLVTTLLWSGRPRDAEARARDALAMRLEPTVEGRIRLGLVRSLAAQGRPEDVFDEAQLAIGGASVSPELRSQLQAEAANALAFGPDLTAAEQWAHDAIATGTAVRSEGAEMGLLVLSDVARVRARYGESLAHAIAALEQSRARHATRMHWRPEIFIAMALTNLDRFADAEATIAQGRLADERIGSVAYLPVFHYVAASVMFASARWDEAAAEARSGLALAEEVGLGMLRSWPHGLLALIAVHQDDLETADEWMSTEEDGSLDEPPSGGSSPWMLLARALLAEARDRPDLAAASLRRVWATDVQRGVIGQWRILGPDLVRLALRDGDRDTAEHVTRMLEATAADAAVTSLEGLALLCRGLVDTDLDALLRSVDAYRMGSRPFERARACEEAAVALAHAGRPAEAKSLFDEALDTYEEVAARRDLSRALASMRAVGIGRKRRGARKRPASGWEALTPSELEVVRLAAAGMTNPQIGRRLFVSRRTVQTHLGHAFAKLGISSRVQLATEVARHAADES